MQIYTVHHRSEATGSLTGLSEDAVFVKEGFSWPAFLIPVIWLIYKRMWWVLAAVVAVQALVGGLSVWIGLPETVSVIGSLVISFILGFEGNELYRWTLARKRYQLAAVVAGAGREEAEFRFFSTFRLTPHAPGTLS